MRRFRFGFVLACATALSSNFASAQTWLNPNTGSWTFGANWIGGVAPISATTTRLALNALGSESFTATNDFVGPFVLNALSFNSGSASSIHVDGNALSFAGTAPNITQIGPGAAILSNAIILPSTGGPDAFPVNASNLVLAGSITSAIAPTGTGGAYLKVTGNATLSGDANLLSITAVTGTMTMTGGTHTLTSTLRRNDTLANNTGPWSLNIGESSTGANFNHTGGSIIGGQGFINVGANNSGFPEIDDTIDGTWNISGGSTSAVFGFGNPDATVGRFGILQGNGTINVSNGARLAGRLFEVGRQSSENQGDFIVNVSGAGSRIDAHQLVARGSGRATISVSTGGVIDLTPVDSTGSTGAGLLVIGSPATGPLDVPPQTSRLTIDGPGSVVRAVQSQVGGELGVGTIDIRNGGAYRANTATPGGATGEATFLGDSDALDPGGNDPTSGFGAINVDGAGSTYNQSTPNGGVIVMGGGGGSAQGGDAIIRVTNGGNVTTNRLIVAQDNGSDATLTICGTTSTVTAILNGAGSLGSVIVGGKQSISGSHAAKGTIHLTGGTLSTGTMSIGGGLLDGDGDPIPGGNGTVNVSGGGRMLVSHDLTLAPVTEGAGTLNIFTGTVTVGGSASLAAATFSSARVSVSAGTWTNAGQLQVGGTSAGSAGFALIDIRSNGFVSAGGGASSAVVIHQTGAVIVGSGTSRGTLVAGQGGLIVNGGLFYNAGTINSVGTLSVGGSVLLSDADRNPGGTPSNKKTLDVVGCTLSAAGVIDLNDNDMIIRGGQLIAQIEQFIAAARNGGLWNQPGITSIAAKNHPTHSTTLGVISGADFLGVYGADATFNGRGVDHDDLLIKFTWYGDTDFNGSVNFDDYVRVDGGFNNHRAGWFNGDFDLNGTINFDDYALIDRGFDTQSAVLLRSTIPEPAPAVVISGLAALAAGRHPARRTRRTR